MSEIPRPLAVALDVMREQGDAHADACQAAIAKAIERPPKVADWARTVVIGLYQLGAVYGAGEPLRIGMPRRLVTALARELRGLSPEAPGALPQTASWAGTVHPISDRLKPLLVDGRYVWSVDECVLHGPTGPVTFFATD